MSTSPFAKMPFCFDVALLLEDLGNIPEQSWVRHFNEGYYEGTWSAAALRSPGGVDSRIYPDPAAEEESRDTPLLAKCPYIQGVVDTFECPKTSIRLMRLDSGSKIREHTDLNLAYEDGEIRLHVPIATSSGTEFHVCDQRVPMCAGECWYVNFNLPHRVANNGSSSRIHLVLDCMVNDWLEQVFRSIGFPALSRGIDAGQDVSDENIERVIEELRRQGTETANKLADDLQNRT